MFSFFSLPSQDRKKFSPPLFMTPPGRIPGYKRNVGKLLSLGPQENVTLKLINPGHPAIS